MCRSDHPSFFDPDWDIRESEKSRLIMYLEEELADSINDEEWLKND